jgi:hypothetical protein
MQEKVKLGVGMNVLGWRLEGKFRQDEQDVSGFTD